MQSITIAGRANKLGLHRGRGLVQRQHRRVSLTPPWLSSSILLTNEWSMDALQTGQDRGSCSQAIHLSSPCRGWLVSHRGGAMLPRYCHLQDHLGFDFWWLPFTLSCQRKLSLTNYCRWYQMSTFNILVTFLFPQNFVLFFWWLI